MGDKRSSTVGSNPATPTISHMHYLLYKITNLVNEKIYIGVHQTENINDSYMGSGYRLSKAISKYGLENFKKEIIEEFQSLDEMFDAEREIVNHDFILSKTNYNVALGGKSGGFHGRTHSIEAREKIGLASKNRKHSDETKSKNAKAATNRKHSDETRLKMRDSAMKRWAKV